MAPKTYLDSNGNPIPPPKVYLDSNGNPLPSGPGSGVPQQGAAAKPSLPSGYWLDPLLNKMGTSEEQLTEIQKPDPNHPWNPREAVKAVGNIGGGGMGILFHPINTLANIGGMVTAPFEMMAGTPFKKTVPGEMLQQIRENPYGTVEAAVGQAGAAPFLDAEGRAVAAPVKIIPKVVRGGMDLLSGTGPRVAEELAAKTAKVNEAAADAATKANQKALDAYHSDLENTQANAAKAQEKRAVAIADKAADIQAKDQSEANKIAHQHQQAVQDAKAFNDRVNAKHAANVQEVEQHNAALNNMLDRRRQMEHNLARDTDTYYALEDAKKSEAKAAENAAWEPWRKKMAAVTIDGGEIARPLEKIAQNSPEVARQLRQLQAPAADAPAGSLYAQDRAAIMKAQGFTGNYFDYPESIRKQIDSIAASNGFEPDPIDFDPQAGKPISVDAIHRANSILQQYIRSGRFEGPLLGEMKQVAKTLRAAISRASMDAGAGPELEAARQATIRYQDAFGRERHMPTTHDEIREKQANPEAFNERNDEERLQGASRVAPELTDAYRNVKAQREALKSFPTEDALRKQLKQTPEPPTVGDLRPGYNLKETPQPPQRLLTSGSPRERAMAAAAPVPSAEYPSVPHVTLPEVKKIGLQDIRDAKAEKMTGAKGPAGGAFGHIAAGAGGWHLIHSALSGNPEGILTGGALAVAPYALAKVLKMPAVVKLLSEPTPADIAAIPPELRGDLPAIVKAAQAQGIKVHPALVVMAGATNASRQ